MLQAGVCLAAFVRMSTTLLHNPTPVVLSLLASALPCHPLMLSLLTVCRRVKTRGFGHLPTAADMAAACSPSGVLQQPGLRGVISKQQTATAR